MQTIDDLIGPHGEIENRVLLRDFCIYELRITNSFYKHKDVYRFTWKKRGSNSIIDYTIAKKLIWSYFMDTRVGLNREAELSKIKAPKPCFHKKTQKVV